MAKRLVFLITFAMPVFVCSCSAAGLEQSGSEPNDVPTVTSEPNEPEPNEVEPAGPEPNNVGLDRATPFHAQCAGILKEFVDDKGVVDYKGLRRKRLELRAVLNQFDNLDPNEYKSWAKEDRIAFWINAYNLQKLKVVADNYPIEPSSRILTIYWGPSSIRHIEQKMSRHKFLVMDEEFTFAGVEKRFFRGEFGDPRVFFALSNACVSSPPLRNEPYCGRKLDEQLDAQTGKFLAPSPLGVPDSRSGLIGRSGKSIYRPCFNCRLMAKSLPRSSPSTESSKIIRLRPGRS